MRRGRCRISSMGGCEIDRVCTPQQQERASVRTVACRGRNERNAIARLLERDGGRDGPEPSSAPRGSAEPVREREPAVSSQRIHYGLKVMPAPGTCDDTMTVPRRPACRHESESMIQTLRSLTEEEDRKCLMGDGVWAGAR